MHCSPPRRAEGLRIRPTVNTEETAMRRVPRLGWLRAFLVFALLAPAAATARAGGPRLVIEVEEPFLLQGHRCPAGTVSVRLVSRFNPSSTLHEVCVGTTCLGVFRAHDVVREGGEDRESFRFERNRHGDLVLLGYTLRRGGKTEFFRFSSSSNISRQRLASVWRPNAFQVR
jgi:hypothetical protein